MTFLCRKNVSIDDSTPIFSTTGPVRYARDDQAAPVSLAEITLLPESRC
jgi:hypothetical protein